MLTLQFDASSRDCAGLTRRSFLRAGALGLGGLSLPWLLRARVEAAAADPDYVKDKAVVLVFLAGGASHIETFNPNMDAPEPYCSVTGEVKTPIPGITLGGTFPELARHAKHLAIVRSFCHTVANHEQAISHVLTGGTDVTGQAKDGCSIGSMYARARGANHPATGLPTYAVLTAPHKDPQYTRELQRVVVGSRAGSLGATYEPFIPTAAGPALANMQLRVPADRLADRRALLKQLDGLKRGLDARDTTQGYDQFEQQAVDLLTSGVGKAFDISHEPAAIREKYDTRSFSCGKKVFEPSILGDQFLLARRLLEAGCGFVTVQSAGWDMHADGNNPGIKPGMEMLGRPLDKALATFLDDLGQRGLLEKVLVIVTGDFGRTPKINKNGGRDHWATLSTLAFFGGGLKTGQVIGKSARNNDVPASDPISTPNLLATVMHYLFDPVALRITRGLPTIVANAESAKPIEALF
ncbi:MAG TPA: DUF1501 domain-containing protein [Gemmataceae bacterium]|nr:DUF1501 domain-containing protein [Gemmataceae bacterium]